MVIKREIATRLQAAFDKPSWTGKLVVFSGNTDCYQPLEATYGLTRACLEVCASYRNPVGIITKSTLIERDIDLLQTLHSETHLDLVVSIPFDDAEVARGIEPGVPTPQRRYKTIERLAAAGLAVGVNVAPIIPGLNDETVATVLTRSRDAGAIYFGHTMVPLPGAVRDVFEHRVRTLFPNRADKVMSAIRQARGGATTESAFGARMTGAGPRWQAIERLVQQTADRLGFKTRPAVPSPSPFQRPPKTGDQLSLFG
ncbi:MAG: DNA repair photolyase [Myxococcota bacterium]